MGCAPSSSQANHIKVCRLEETALVDFHDKYLLGKKLGRGAFAQVRVVTDANWNDWDDWDTGDANPDKAVKIIQLRHEDRTPEQNAKLLATAKKESRLWEELGAHPNCVRLYETMYGDNFAFMVMEKCNSSLLSHLESTPELNERAYGRIFSQVLMGIAHCHSLRIIHRDIKPDNFLVGQDCETVKLADFGLSTQMIVNGKRASGIFGTAPYMCPEMLAGEPYTDKLDIWSFAVMVYVLLFGLFPYMPERQNANAMKQAIMLGGVPSFKPAKKQGEVSAPRYSDDAVSFVQALLHRAPEQRPSAQDALRFPWIQNAQKGCHAQAFELPSLRPLLYASKKIGAFEARDPCVVSPIDSYLNAVQMERHGIALDGSRDAQIKTLTSKTSVSAGADHCSKDAWEKDSECTNSTQPPCGSAPSCSRTGSMNDSQSDRGSVDDSQSDRGASIGLGTARQELPRIVALG
jgi:serine/threonine protein kinase